MKEVAQSCPTLCNPLDCSLPGSFVHGIFQARVLEWDAIAFSILNVMKTTKTLRDEVQCKWVNGYNTVRMEYTFDVAF